MTDHHTDDELHGPLGLVGFSRRADIYERARPGYPDALIDLLGQRARLGPHGRVADVAAGTGKLSRQLQATGAHCVAVEPSHDMRSVCRQRAPEVSVVGGTAEALPLASGSCDLVTVAQAFHWFDAERALEEIARVLRPRGAVALVWNERDGRVPWVAELGRLMHSAGHPAHARAAAFHRVLDGCGLFGPADQVTLPFTDQVDRSGLLDLVASRSYVNVLGADDRAQLLEQVASLTVGLPEPITVPYRTEVLLASTPGPA